MPTTGVLAFSLVIAFLAVVHGENQSISLTATKPSNHHHFDPRPGSVKHLAAFGHDRSATLAQTDDVCGPEPLLESYFKKVDQAGGFHIEKLQEMIDDPLFGIAFKIKQGQLTWNTKRTSQASITHRAQWFRRTIERVINEMGLPDMELVVSMGDGAPGPRGGFGVPGPPGLFKVEGFPGEDLLFLPRSLVLSDLDLDKCFRQNASCPPEQRKPVAIFRGSTTGCSIFWRDLERENRTGAPPRKGRASSGAFCHPKFCTTGAFPRYFAARLSVRRPDLLDAGLTSIVQAVPEDSKGNIEDVFSNEGLMRPFVRAADQQCYAAVLVIDGNTLPDRLPCQLAWGMPVVFMRMAGEHGPPTSEFWYDEMRHGTHFLNATLETLEATLEQLLQMPDHGAEIGRNGAMFVRDRLSQNRLLCYAHKALTMYGGRYARALQERNRTKKGQERNKNEEGIRTGVP